ncbi:hypothetical protein BDZ85DRAFT_308985 [Elsinoe ampelina]|uniref:Uncharacterized protein n=1 Tax=Elsinoe ampelina TaxID=302913 RepID=A0A6A6GHG1_9PEZI|nr:hypothetical protein BDZ85DRAFT_308985 [Elsinoe ampelina]
MFRAGSGVWTKRLWPKSDHGSLSGCIQARHVARQAEVLETGTFRKVLRTNRQRLDIPVNPSNVETTAAPGRLAGPMKVEVPFAVDIDSASLAATPSIFQISKIKLRRHKTQDPTRPKYEAILDLEYGTSLSTGSPKQGIGPDKAMAVSQVLNFLSNVIVDESTTLTKSLTVYSSSHGSRLDELIEQLSPLALPETQGEPLYIVLATAKYAADLVANEDVVPSILARLVPDSIDHESVNAVQALVAVVDKLPTREPLPPMSVARSVSKRTARVLSDDSGLEGISVSVSTSTHYFATETAKDNWSADSTRFTHSLEPDKPGTLTFNINPAHSEVLQDLMDSGGHADVSGIKAYSIQIPLAATIFSNGLKSTLILGRYSRADDGKRFVRQKEQNVQHAQITLAASPGIGSANVAAINLPLLKLTNSKSVTSCMGNIVREMGPPQDVAEKSTQPASFQLENAVAQYFKALGISPHAMSVWALVVPKDLANSEDEQHRRLATALTPAPSMFDSLPNADNHWQYPGSPLLGLRDMRIDELFAQGVRLVRVTSGGGGWGNKAGLLSFDPDTSYESTAVPFAEALLAPDLDGDSAPVSGLKEIARKGDLVQFHFLPDQVLNPGAPLAPPQIIASRPGEYSVDFGVIPSTVDEPLSAGSDAWKEADREIKVIVNHFGALSEKGMSLKIRTFDMAKSHVVPADRDTKIDVPYSRFSIRHLPYLGQKRRTRQKVAADKAEAEEEVEEGDDDAMFSVVDAATAQTSAEEMDAANIQALGKANETESMDTLGGDAPKRKKKPVQGVNFSATTPRRHAMLTSDMLVGRMESIPNPLEPDHCALDTRPRHGKRLFTVRYHARKADEDKHPGTRTNIPRRSEVVYRFARSTSLPDAKEDESPATTTPAPDDPNAALSIAAASPSDSTMPPFLHKIPMSPPTLDIREKIISPTVRMLPSTTLPAFQEREVRGLTRRLGSNTLPASITLFRRVEHLLSTLPPCPTKWGLERAFLRVRSTWRKTIREKRDPVRQDQGVGQRPATKPETHHDTETTNGQKAREVLSQRQSQDGRRPTFFERGKRRPLSGGRARRYMTDKPDSVEREAIARFNSRVRLARREQGRKELMGYVASGESASDSQAEDGVVDALSGVEDTLDAGRRTSGKWRR